MSTLKYYADLSNEILENSADYKEGKKLIYTFFDKKDKELTLDKIKLRLIIIDTIYSTNMNRRLFGINDLAEKILSISKKSDYILIDKINNFIFNKTEEKEIKEILVESFGISKLGKEKGIATSLLSKYFYFLLEFKFPIYDSLVKGYLPKINDKFQCIPALNLKNNKITYFKTIIEFNQNSEIEDFNKLDNLCWLFGKVNKGSFSLILTKDKYSKLIDSINFSSDSKSNNIDIKIREALKKNIPSDIFKEKEVEFIKWALSHNAN